LGCTDCKNPQNEHKTIVTPKAGQIILEVQTPESIAAKFYMSDTVCDLIMYANFGEDRLRNFGVAMDRIFGFSIDLRRRITTLSHYRATAST